MKLTYGTYEMSLTAQWYGGAAVAITREPRRDSTGRRVGYTERWNVQGWLTAATAADLTTAIAALHAAFSQDFKDLKLANDAVTPNVDTAHVLLNAGSLNGVRVTQAPTFPEGKGAEYATMRSFSLQVEADYEDAGAPELLAFVETLSITGTGGPRFIVQVPLNGAIVPQQVADQTPVMVTQSGSALGLHTWPTVPGPLLGDGEHVDRRKVERKGPRRTATGAYRDFEVSWSYEFEGAQPTTANPHLWGA